MISYWRVPNLCVKVHWKLWLKIWYRYTFPRVVARELLENYPKIRLKWWWLPRFSPDTATYYTWRSKHWWYMLIWKIVNPIFHLAFKQGIWKMREGALYTSGHIDFGGLWDKRS
jgi:hypothetical protein